MTAAGRRANPPPMSERTVFLTGITGFVGRRVAAALADRGHRVLGLVRPGSRGLAEAEFGERSSVELLDGDLHRDGLLSPADRARVVASCDSVLHCAGLADPASGPDLAELTVVEGTARVLALAEDIPDLRLVLHLSCAARLRGPGLFAERPIAGATDPPARAEQAVFGCGLPALVLRPASIVGDSRTGEVDAQLGPTRLITALLRYAQAHDRIPAAPFGRDAAVNAVPVDFVVDALLAFWAGDHRGVLHLADPTAPTVRAFLDAVAPLVGLRPPALDLPAGLAQALYDRAPPLRRLLDEAHNLPRPAIAAMATRASIDTTLSDRILRPLGLQTPHLLGYLPRLVEYARGALV